MEQLITTFWSVLVNHLQSLNWSYLLTFIFITWLIIYFFCNDKKGIKLYLFKKEKIIKKKHIALIVGLLYAIVWCYFNELDKRSIGILIESYITGQLLHVLALKWLTDKMDDGFDFIIRNLKKTFK